jgi:hypothetical protein
VEIPQSVSHYYDGEGYNIEFVIESVDGETIADDNQGENGEDDSENKENDSNQNDDTKKGEPSKETQNDANQEGGFSSGKRNVGSDPPPSDHEVVNIGSLTISYSPCNDSPSRVIGLIEDLAVIEKKNEEKVVCGTKEMLPGDHMSSPLQAVIGDMSLGIVAEKACVLEMVDQRDNGVIVSLPRQEFEHVSLPQASSLLQVGSAYVSLPWHDSEDNSLPHSLSRQEPAIVSLPKQAGTWSSPPASPIQDSGLRAAEVSLGLL